MKDKAVTNKKVYIRTFGCQMNVRDSEVVAGLLKKSGYKIQGNPEDADIVIFNTCSVRQHAEDKVWSEIGRVSKMHRASSAKHPPLKRRLKIGLVGCMAQNYKETAFERSPDIDFVVGPADIDKIPEILKKLNKGQPLKNGDSPLFQSKIWETDAETRPEEIYHTGFYEDKNHAFIVISEGCSNFCSYCVVPYVRGPMRQRHSKDVIKEIKTAINKGITSITLLGQNVNAYKDGNVDFIKLIELINSIKGLKTFTFLTSHPKDTSVALFKAISELDKLKKNLHLPIQSGSDRILSLMNRSYSRKFYLDLVNNYRNIVKGGLLSSDIIVGFPTESEEDFKETYDLVKDVEFNAAYIFKYSPRPKTQALKLSDDVTRQVKENRHKAVLDLQKGISKNNAKRHS